MLKKSVVAFSTGVALLLVASPSYSWELGSFFQRVQSFFQTYDTHSSGGQSCEKDEPGTPVPEPTAALLFGAGMVVAGAASRRRARR
jgi:hypothetical protein